MIARTVALAAVLAMLASTAPVLADGKNLAEALRNVLTDLPQPGVQCGAMVLDLQTSETIYSQAADKPMVPASNQKLIVMATAIEQLGPQWAFRTRLAVRGDDLVIVGDGDPGLGDERLAEQLGEGPLSFLDTWAEALIHRGHERLSGNLVVDGTIFDEQFVHPDWEAADLLKWYGSPIGGLNLCNNCVELTVWPADAGEPASWSLFPTCPLATVDNRCVSAPDGDATPIVGRMANSFELVLSGKVSQRGTLQPIAVPQPNAFAAAAIRARLTACGVTVAGEVRFERLRGADGRLPRDCELIAEHVTALPAVLNRIGVNSQNMFAESLLKRLGYEWSRERSPGSAVGSWENGRHAAREVLRRAGCNVDNIVMADASGLSRQNRISAQDFVRLLAYMYTRPQRQLLIDNLAGSENGGTLKRRMSSLDGQVFAKTGYLRGIRTLSGYVKTADNRWYAFSVLFNGFRGGSSPYNRLHDRVCAILADSVAGSP